jgi:hypothetical protein
MRCAESGANWGAGEEHRRKLRRTLRHEGSPASFCCGERVFSPPRSLMRCIIATSMPRQRLQARATVAPARHGCCTHQHHRFLGVSVNGQVLDEMSCTRTKSRFLKGVRQFPRPDPRRRRCTPRIVVSRSRHSLADAPGLNRNRPAFPSPGRQARSPGRISTVRPPLRSDEKFIAQTPRHRRVRRCVGVARGNGRSPRLTYVSRNSENLSCRTGRTREHSDR